MRVDPGDFTPASLAAIAPACGEGCAAPSVELVSGEEVYPHRQDLARNHYWRCNCGAYVGVHPNLKPLGTPAHKALRDARGAAHAVFDPLWRRRAEISGIKPNLARARGYKWLAAQMGMAAKDCHIGMMTIDQARRVVEICNGARNG